MRRRRHSHRRGKNKSVRNIVLGSFAVLFLLATGYSAFSTNITLTAKGNIKDIKKEVDDKVPTNDLLFWGQADNKENTLTTLKDKSSHGNDGILNGFDNTNVSGFYNDELIFDGIDDYVNIGYANYDFKNSQSYVLYVKLNRIDKWMNMFGNWEGAGGGLNFDDGKQSFRYELHNGSVYITPYTNKVEKDKYYTLIATYNGTSVQIYLDGLLCETKNSSMLKKSPVQIFIGANDNSPYVIDFSNISLKEAMLYDRALTETEVKTITEGFERKYKK